MADSRSGTEKVQVGLGTCCKSRKQRSYLLNTYEGVSKIFRSEHEEASPTLHLNFNRNKNISSLKCFKYMLVDEFLLEVCFQILLIM